MTIATGDVITDATAGLIESGAVAGFSGYSGGQYLTPRQMAKKTETVRDRKNLMTWGILTRNWDEYQIQPAGLPADVWASMVRRFSMTDLATPVLTTISSAVYGGKVARRLKKAVNKDEVEAYMLSAKFDEMISALAVEAFAYGTSYIYPTWESDDVDADPCFVIVPQLSTRIKSPEDDPKTVTEIQTRYSTFTRIYRAGGIVDRKGKKESPIPNTNFGFVPVVVARGRHVDSTSPYGESLIWPAVEESKQVTFLGNDLVVLERSQSFSTLFMKGNFSSNPKETAFGPWFVLRADDEFADAKYISPAAEIDKIDSIVDKKYERVAAQCNVPIEIFKQSKAGTDPTAVGALLTHKPLYDLARAMQKQFKATEHEIYAMVDAMISWSKGGGKPVDLEEFRKNLELETVFELESNPAMTTQDAQTWEQLVESGFVSYEKAYWHFNPDGTDEECQALKAEREKSRTPPVVVQSFPTPPSAEVEEPQGEEMQQAAQMVPPEMAQRAGM